MVRFVVCMKGKERKGKKKGEERGGARREKGENKGKRGGGGRRKIGEEGKMEREEE